MFNLNKNKNIVYLILVGIVLIMIEISLCYGLSVTEQFAQIVIAISALFAAVTYFYQKDHDKSIAIIEQISFFRKEVLPANDSFVLYIRSKYPELIIPAIKLDIPSLKYVRENHHEKGQVQIDLLKKFNTAEDREKFSMLQVNLLNALEEFSSRVICSKSFIAEELIPVRFSFIQLVEVNVIRLLMMKEIYAPGSYQSIVTLYSSWKDSIDRKTTEERIKEIGESFRKDIL